MTLVSSFAPSVERSSAGSVNLKYVKQTYDVLSRSDINLELIAQNISQLPVREQKKFFRLLLNYVDLTSQKSLGSNPTMQDVIMLCERIIDLVNDYYEEQELQLTLEGM